MRDRRFRGDARIRNNKSFMDLCHPAAKRRRRAVGLGRMLRDQRLRESAQFCLIGHSGEAVAPWVVVERGISIYEAREAWPIRKCQTASAAQRALRPS